MKDPPTVIHLCPPIPNRNFDYIAFYDPESNEQGYGATAQEAVNQLNELLDNAGEHSCQDDTTTKQNA